MKQFIYVGLLGVMGVFARYYIDSRYAADGQRSIALATFFINVVGSLLIGFAYVAFLEKGMIERSLGIGIMSGLLGGFTTFSGYSLQFLLLLQDGSASLALVYLVGSPIVGVFLAWIGLNAARLIL